MVFSRAFTGKYDDALDLNHVLVRVRPGTPASFEAILASRLRRATPDVTFRVRRMDAMRQLMLSGWQLSPIITATTGVPFTVTTGTDASLTGVGNDRPNLIGSPRAQNAPTTTWLNKASFSANTAGTYGRTRPFEFYGPHYTNIDTALSKFIPLHEALQLEARAECFNCLNHTNYANPGGAINSNGLGVTNPGNVRPGDGAKRRIAHHRYLPGHCRAHRGEEHAAAKSVGRADHH